MNTLKKYEFILKDLDCANCANKIQNKLAENKDYKNVNVNFNTLKLTLESDLEDIRSDIVKVVAELEPEVEVLDAHHHEHSHDEHEEKNNKFKINKNFVRLAVGIILMIFGIYIELPGYCNLICTDRKSVV